MEKDIVDPLIEPTEPEQRHEQPINQPPAPQAAQASTGHYVSSMQASQTV